jgi:hypothetical protein
MSAITLGTHRHQTPDGYALATRRLGPAGKTPCTALGARPRPRTSSWSKGWPYGHRHGWSRSSVASLGSTAHRRRRTGARAREPARSCSPPSRGPLGPLLRATSARKRGGSGEKETARHGSGGAPRRELEARQMQREDGLRRWELDPSA